MLLCDIGLSRIAAWEVRLDGERETPTGLLRSCARCGANGLATMRFVPLAAEGVVGDIGDDVAVIAPRLAAPALMPAYR
jgi:hypothetical protein